MDYEQSSPQETPDENTWGGCWLAEAYETRSKVAKIVEEVQNGQHLSNACRRFTFGEIASMAGTPLMREVVIEETPRWPSVAQVREGIISAAMDEVPLGVADENEGQDEEEEADL